MSQASTHTHSHTLTHTALISQVQEFYSKHQCTTQKSQTDRARRARLARRRAARHGNPHGVAGAQAVLEHRRLRLRLCDERWRE